MTEPTKDPKNQEETTVLHLDKFAPQTPDAGPAPVPPAEEGMTVFIQKAAAETVQQTPQKVVVPKDASAMTDKEMLGAVSYCYAKEVYESDAIERKMRQDPALKKALGEKLPDAKSIRRFRRLNRDAIQNTLEKAFGLRRKKARELMKTPLPGQPEPPKVVDPKPDGESTVMFVKKEAATRLENAIIIDTNSQED